jgi:hypothetical protein
MAVKHFFHAHLLIVGGIMKGEPREDLPPPCVASATLWYSRGLTIYQHQQHHHAVPWVWQRVPKVCHFGPVAIHLVSPAISGGLGCLQLIDGHNGVSLLSCLCIVLNARPQALNGGLAGANKRRDAANDVTSDMAHPWSRKR